MQLWFVFIGTQERVRNSHGKRAIGVRAIEVLLYYYMYLDSDQKEWSDQVWQLGGAVSGPTSETSCKCGRNQFVQILRYCALPDKRGY